MIDEQIKKEIEKIVKDELKEVKESLTILSLPLISQYRVLTWYGNADGVNLFLPAFDINSIIGRYIIIKSIEFVSYYVNNSVDINFSDGTTETIQAGVRVNRMFDTWSNFALGAHLFRMTINGNLIPFQITAEQGVPPPDFKIDNIYYKYPQKLESMNILYGTEIMESNVGAGTPVHPNVKIFVECYLL